MSPPDLCQQSTARSDSPLVGLDALRGWAAVAVVVLHASVPYVHPSMPGLDWSVVDTPSRSVTWLFWAIEVNIMPIFLMMAGFLAARSMNRGGVMATMKSRLNRWGKPLLLATILLVPVELYIWLLGWVAEGHITFRKLQSLKIDPEQSINLWGLSHLWFLQYIMTYVVLLALGWKQLVKSAMSYRTYCCLPALMVIAVAILTYAPEVVWGFQHSFFPVFTKWLYSGLFFAGGAIWWSCDPDLRSLARKGDRLLAPSILFWGATVCFGIWYLSQTSVPFSIRILLALVTVAAAVGTTFGLVGSCMHRVQCLGWTTKRLAAASLMIYLIHHPVVGLAHIAAKYAVAEVPSWLKVAGTSMLGMSVALGVNFLVARSQSRKREVSRQGSADVLPFEPVVRKPASYSESHSRAA